MVPARSCTSTRSRSPPTARSTATRCRLVRRADVGGPKRVRRARRVTSNGPWRRYVRHGPEDRTRRCHGQLLRPRRSLVARHRPARQARCDVRRQRHSCATSSSIRRSAERRSLLAERPDESGQGRACRQHPSPTRVDVARGGRRDARRQANLAGGTMSGARRRRRSPRRCSSCCSPRTASTSPRVESIPQRDPDAEAGPVVRPGAPLVPRAAREPTPRHSRSAPPSGCAGRSTSTSSVGVSTPSSFATTACARTSTSSPACPKPQVLDAATMPFVIDDLRGDRRRRVAAGAGARRGGTADVRPRDASSRSWSA